MAIPPHAAVPIRSSLALTRRWVALLAPPIFDRRSLWLTWLGADGVQSPLLLPVDDVPARPGDELLRGLLQVHVGATEGQPEAGGHLAMALCRPGSAVQERSDAAWAHALHDLLDERIDGTWSLHLAAGGSVEPVVEAPSFFLSVAVAARSSR